MSALSLLIILLNLFNISYAFGCCGKKKGIIYRPVAARVSKPVNVQDIVNRDCKADQNFCRLQNKGINSLDGVKFPAHLTILHLSLNNISSLKNARFPAGLIELYLASNKLNFATGFSMHLTYLTSLQKLDLNYNKIRVLANLNLPENLTVLLLEGNEIGSFVDIGNLQYLSSLRLLNLAKNQIRSVTTNIRDQLPTSLESLTLTQNGLTIIQTEVPDNLCFLDLTNNPLDGYHIHNFWNNDGCRILTDNTPLKSTSVVHHISRLPTLVWREQIVHEMRCQICCEDFVNGDNVIILPCLHKYHCKCVYPWLVDKQTCPECRHNIHVLE